MFKDSFEGVTISVYIDTRKKLKTELFPVKIRVTHNRTSQYYPTGKELSEAEWLAMPSTKKRDLLDIRKDISVTYDSIKDIVRELVHSGIFSFDHLKQRLGLGENISLNVLFREKIAELLGEDRIGSMLHYQYALDKLSKHYGASVPVDAINVDWLKKYEKKLAVTLSVNTIGMQLRCIRALMNIAKKRMYIKEGQYPFGEGKYEIKKGASIKKALQIQQIGEIARYKEGSKSLQFYKDMWLFSYLCNGINPADIIKLKYSNIVDNEIVFVRQKTERSNGTVKIIQAPVSALMQEIIDRWGNEPNSDSYIFPILKGGEDAMQRKMASKYFTQRLISKMNEVGKALEIGNISCLTARHSFATVLKRSGANIASISESLGHGDLKTTENYLASFEKDERDKNASMLTNFD